MVLPVADRYVAEGLQGSDTTSTGWPRSRWWKAWAEPDWTEKSTGVAPASMIACQGRGQLDLLDAFVGDREGNGLCGQHGVGHRVLLGLVVTPGGKRSWLRYWRRAPLAHGSAHGGLSPILA